jgi:hypothetical protein
MLKAVINELGAYKWTHGSEWMLNKPVKIIESFPEDGGIHYVIELVNPINIVSLVRIPGWALDITEVPDPVLVETLIAEVKDNIDEQLCTEITSKGSKCTKKVYQEGLCHQHFKLKQEVNPSLKKISDSVPGKTMSSFVKNSSQKHSM